MKNDKLVQKLKQLRAMDKFIIEDKRKFKYKDLMFVLSWRQDRDVIDLVAEKE
jgi:hypothetical protein